MFNKLWTKQRCVPLRYVLLVILVCFISFALRSLKRSRTENVIRILCFGDSLTAGTLNRQLEQTKSSKTRHPYSLTLQQRFDFHDHTVLGGAIRPIFEVHNAGVPGERVVDQMLPRLRQILQDARTGYSWVIILGGTNDLRNYRNMSLLGDYKSIFHALTNLHNIGHNYGARTVAVTIPDRECIGTGTCYYLKKAQYKINELLRDFAAKNTGKVILADLASEIFLPRDASLWNDWVHLTAKGYDKMADIIYNSMSEHV